MPAVPAASGLEARLSTASAALKKEFEKVRANIAKLRAQGSAAFDALYEEIGRVIESDPPLYIAGGYTTVRDFIAAELPGETQRSVQRNVLVARCFSPEDEARHGIGFLEEVALYAKELAGAKEPPRAIHLDRLVLDLPVKGGSSIGKPAREASIDDVRRARRALKRGATSRRTASPAEKALRAALGKSKALATVSVSVQGSRASFGGVPLDALGAFAKAVGAAGVPKGRDS
jgi:hypothetical protein